MLAKSNFGKSLIPWLFIGLATFTSNVAAATPVKNLLCSYPLGASTYLPGGRVPASAGGTVADAYTGVLRLTLRLGVNTDLIEAAWIRKEQRLSTNDPSEGGQIYRIFANDEIKRFDIRWGRGNSEIILIKQLESSEPIVAYASISAGFGMDKVSSYIATCDVVPVGTDLETATTAALKRVLDAVASDATADEPAQSDTGQSSRPKP